MTWRRAAVGEAVAERSGLNRSAIRLLQLTALVSTLDRFAMPPMLVAISRDLNLPLSTVVAAAGAYFLAYGLMQPVWGIVSDRLGLVRTLRVALGLVGAMGRARWRGLDHWERE